MWTLQPEADYENKAKHWPKKHRRELLATLDNLDTFVTALNQGAKLEQVKFGFVHREPRGILAIDQKGGGAGLKETRLYTYPIQAMQLIHIITIGDKSTQKADIRYCCVFVDSLPLRTDQD